MAGLPVELFDRVYAAGEGSVAADSPVMYDVWREYAVRGPQARPRLLLALAEDSNPEVVAGALDDPRGDVDSPPIGVAVEWLVMRADLKQLLLVVLPHTRWWRAMRLVSALSRTALAALMAPLDELLGRPDISEATSPPASEDTPPVNAPGSSPSSGPRVDVEFTERDEEIASWLLRLLARIWGFDADLDSERELAAGELREVLQPLRSAGVFLDQADIDSVSLDRPAAPAAIDTRVVIKADAAMRLFSVDASKLVWAVLDTGINAGHPAFRAYPDLDSSRVVKTYDLTRLDDAELMLAEKGPVDHLVDLMQTKSISWPGTPEEPYREPVHRHGTHVAGILAGCLPADYAQRAQAPEFYGVCPDLRLWDFRVLGDRADGNESRILLALRFIRVVNERERTLRIAGVNMSLSLAYDPKNHACGWTPVCREVRRLIRSGVVVVVAAGNAGYKGGSGTGAGIETVASGLSKGSGFHTVSVTDPGNTEEAITVGATGEHPFRYGTSYFSGKGPTADGRFKPDLLAPGQDIYGPAGTRWRRESGTSQATPQVSGAAALLMARYPELVGEPERVKDILCRTATDLGRDRHFQGHGLVDVLRAAQSL